MPVNNGEESEEESTPQSQPQQEKRPILPKYATTTHADKKFASVSTTDFNKNLTIEKARFDSSCSANIPHPPSASNSTPISPPLVTTPPPIEEQNDSSNNNNNNKSTTIPPLTTSVTLPIVATIQSMSGPSTPTTASTISTMPSQSTPLMTKSIKPTKTEVNKIKQLTYLSFFLNDIKNNLVIGSSKYYQEEKIATDEWYSHTFRSVS